MRNAAWDRIEIVFRRISFHESGGVKVSTCLVRLKLRAEVPGTS